MSSETKDGGESKVSTLKGNLGPIGIAMMVVATAAPLTVMAGVSPLIIGFGNGAAAPTDAILVGIVMLLFSVGFVEMSKFITNAGASEGVDQVVQLATQNAGSMYLDTVQKFLGKFFHDAGQVLLITSLFAVVLSIHNIVARYKYILGSCGVLMARLGKVHTKHASPYVASAVQTFVSLSVLLVAAIIQMDPVTQVYTWGAAAGTLGYMIIVAMACLAVILFFYRRNEQSNFWKTRIAPFLGLLGLIAFLYIAFTNLSALTGSEGAHPVNVVIVLLLIVSFLIGSAGAGIMMIKAPKRFQAILESM